MEEMALRQPDLIGREEELAKLESSLDSAIEGGGSTVFIAGEAGIGKTRLVAELMRYAESKDVRIIKGWCLAEGLEPLMPVRTALRDEGLHHLISSAPPPLVVSAYLMNDAGMLISQAERAELELDPLIFSSMLSAVGSFVKDAMQMVEDAEMAGGLNILGYQDYKIIIEESGGLHLACVTKGDLSEFLVTDMKEILAEVHRSHGDILADWDGDMSAVEPVDPIVGSLIKGGKYDGQFIVDDAKLKQENLFDNVLLGIQRLREERPLMLFIDDLHWADPSTLALLHYLARNTRGHGVLIIGTYRPEDIVDAYDGKPHQLATAMHDMRREGLLEVIELRRLDSTGVGGMVSSALGGAAFGQDFMERIYAETEGNPFFIMEVTRLLVEEGVLARGEDLTWAPAADIESIDIPSKVYDVVKRRLDRLMKEQKRLLDCASVAGEEFRSDVVGRVTGVDRLVLLENLSEIEKTHQLIHYLTDKYRFDHAKIRAVLYEGINEELRKEYHRLIADTIKELHGDEPPEVNAELAYHYSEAGDGSAGRYLLRAGDIARENYANKEAIRYYTDALRFLEGEAAVGAHEKLADVQKVNGDLDNAIENLLKANELTGISETRARSLRKTAAVHSMKGGYDKSLELLAEAKELVSEGTEEHGKVVLAEGYGHFWLQDLDRAMAVFREAVGEPAKLGINQADVAKALRSIGNIHHLRGENDSALEYFGKSLAAAEEIKDEYGIAAAFNNIGTIHYERSDLDGALEHFQRTMETIERIGDQQGLSMSTLNIGNVLFCKGDLDKAMDFYQRTYAIRQKLGNPANTADGLFSVGLVHLERGEYEEGLEHLERAMNDMTEAGNEPMAVYAQPHVAEAHLALGHREEAVRNAEAAIERAVALGHKAFEGIGRRTLGNIHRESGEAAKAAEEYEKAVALFEETGAASELTRAHYEQGLLKKARGDAVGARELLDKALAEFERQGMMLWAERCTDALEGL